METVDVQLEVGAKRVFATAVDWPGRSRSASDQDAALAALVAYSTRYGQAIAASKIVFAPPASVAALTVVEAATGSSSTDFGVPSVPSDADGAPWHWVTYAG